MFEPPSEHSGHSEMDEKVEQPKDMRLDVHRSLGRAGQLPCFLGESVWHDLERQIAAFVAQQEESKRLLALIGREQESFIADLHSFVKDQVHGVASRAESRGRRAPPKHREQPARDSVYMVDEVRDAACAEGEEPVWLDKDLEQVLSPHASEARAGRPSWQLASDGVSVHELPAWLEAEDGAPQSVRVEEAQGQLRMHGHDTASSRLDVPEAELNPELLNSKQQGAVQSDREVRTLDPGAEDDLVRREWQWSFFGGGTKDVTQNPSDSSFCVKNQPSWPHVALSHYNNEVRMSTTFHELVHIPPIQNGLRAWLYGVADWLLRWKFFEPVMGIVIALNAANIGWSINRELLGQPTEAQEIIETIFLCIFILELVLRFYVRGFKTLRSKANAFDFMLILVTALTQIAKPMLVLIGSGQAVRYVEQLMILRMMRLLRLARAVRLVASFNSLWKLVQGIMHCCSTMVSAMVLILISIYIFACFGAEFISKPLMGDSEVGHIISRQFSTLPQVLLTLFQFISMDSTAAIYVPLIQRTPALSLYFLPLLVIVAIALMNLITALIVEEAISTAHMDEEMRNFYMRRRLKVLTPALRGFFRSLDKSGDGKIEIREIVQSIKQGIHIPKELQDLLNPARMLDLFEALDSDRSGDLSESEFVDGLGCIAIAEVPLETIQILHLIRSMRKELRMARLAVSAHRHSDASDDGHGHHSRFVHSHFSHLRNDDSFSCRESPLHRVAGAGMAHGELRRADEGRLGERRRAEDSPRAHPDEDDADTHSI